MKMAPERDSGRAVDVRNALREPAPPALSPATAHFAFASVSVIGTVSFGEMATSSVRRS
jgi:hypothetical protein